MRRIAQFDLNLLETFEAIYSEGGVSRAARHLNLSQPAVSHALAKLRDAFGNDLIVLGKNLELVSRARIEIEAMRLMVLKAAKAMDVLGNKEARVWVSMVKAMVPDKRSALSGLTSLVDVGAARRVTTRRVKRFESAAGPVVGTA